MLWLTFLKAFAVGGAICLIGQIIINWTHLTNGKNTRNFSFGGRRAARLRSLRISDKMGGCGSKRAHKRLWLRTGKGRGGSGKNRRRCGRFYRRTCRLRNRSVRCDFLRLSRRADFQTAYKNLLIWAGQAQNLLLRNKIV